MSNKRYLVYRLSDGYVVNCINYDGVSPYVPDDGTSIEIVPAGSFAGIGWIRQSNGEYLEPPVIENAAE